MLAYDDRIERVGGRGLGISRCGSVPRVSATGDRGVLICGMSIDEVIV